MQNKELEIIIRRKKLYLSHWSAFCFVIFICTVMGLLIDFYSVMSPYDYGQKPVASDWNRLVSDGWQMAFIFLFMIFPFLHVIRHPFAPSFYRINLEGISFPAPMHWLSSEGVCYPILIQWHEIQALCPYTYFSVEHVPVLGIVLRDDEAVVARSLQEHAPGWVRRFFIRYNTRRLLHSPYLATVNLPQFLLPISIDELLREITTHFGAELGEHGVIVLEWQGKKMD